MAAASGASVGTGTTNSNLRVEQNKIPEFFCTKSKDMISAADFIRQLEDLVKTDGRILKLTTTLPMHFAIWLVNGYPQWWTGMMRKMTNPCGWISRMFSSKNMQSKRMNSSSWKDWPTWQ
jgi:hypothetical protein